MAVLSCSHKKTKASSPSRRSPQLKRRAERLLETEIAFVHRPNQGSASRPVIADLDQFLADLTSREQSATNRASERSLLPVPRFLLTRDEERLLFLQMNYLKFRANALRCRIDPDRPDREMIDEIELQLVDVKRIRDCLTECNLRLVLSIARKLSNSHGQFEELVGDGLPILMRCVELFDASRGFRFSTYVTHSVQRHLYRVIHRIHRRSQRFASTDEEILRNVADVSDGLPQPMLDHSAIVSTILQDAAAQLDSRERLIIDRRFGLDGDPTQTLREIAQDLGISKERVRQLQIRAMDKLQDVAQTMEIDADLL